MERSDAARREDNLYDNLGKVKRENRRLERIITEARKGAFGFIIKTEETLQQGMVRNYQEFSDEQARLNKQVEILKEMIIMSQMAKLCWCDKCRKQRSMKEWKDKLEQELDALLFVKEVQDGKAKTQNNT